MAMNLNIFYRSAKGKSKLLLININKHIRNLRLEQFKAVGQQIESKPIVSEQKSRPLMKYAAKKTNTDQEQRAKTVDIIRLKSGK